MLKFNINIVSLTLMTISAVDNIRNLPSIAIFGKQILFFYLVAAVFFFIPCALVSAQLSSASDTENGVYYWLKKAFGAHYGLIAVWLQWTENLVWYPTLLTFIVGTIGYYFSPTISADQTYLITASIFCFYVISALNIFNFKLSVNLSNLCAIFGLILPMVSIILLGANWYLSGNPISDTFLEIPFIPDFFSFNSWIALTSIVMSLCGVEITTAHVKRIKYPQKHYPKALLIATFIILTTLILSSLSIAAVVPEYELSLVSGIVQALEIFLRKNEFLNLLKYFVIAAVIGSLGSLNNWLLSPIQGLQEAAKDGLLPPWLNITNKHGIPVIFLLLQTGIVTLLIYLFSYFPTINSAYWFMTVIASQLYMCMYILMFIAYIKLRNRPEYTFKIPGGNKVRIIVASFGMIGCLMTILVGFIPFKRDWDIISYGLVILSTLTFIVSIPLLFNLRRSVWILSIKQLKYLTTLSRYNRSKAYNV